MSSKQFRSGAVIATAYGYVWSGPSFSIAFKGAHMQIQIVDFGGAATLPATSCPIELPPPGVASLDKGPNRITALGGSLALDDDMPMFILKGPNLSRKTTGLLTYEPRVFVLFYDDAKTLSCSAIECPWEVARVMGGSSFAKSARSWTLATEFAKWSDEE